MLCSPKTHKSLIGFALLASVTLLAACGGPKAQMLEIDGILHAINPSEPTRPNMKVELVEEIRYGMDEGEDEYIFPYQEEADAMFNSSLPYELCVLKERCEELLSAVVNDVTEYAEARRLLRFLSYFLPIPPRDIPRNSILREFIGGSIFKY